MDLAVRYATGCIRRSRRAQGQDWRINVVTLIFWKPDQEHEMKSSSGWLAIGAGIVVTLIPFPLMAWAGLLMIAWGIYRLWAGKRRGNDPWLADKANCPFKWAYDNTGLALDTATRTIHLKNKETAKSYSFDDVREWKYNVQTGGEIINGSVGTNYGIHLKNKAQSGLFIMMRDIEYPQWRISFPSIKFEPRRN